MQFHYRHTAFFLAELPPLCEPWIELVQAGHNGWDSLEAARINTAANLLFSALDPEHHLVGLLKSIPILNANTWPNGQSRTEAGWYADGKVYLNPNRLQYLLMIVETLSHEMEHALRRHDGSPSPETIEYPKVQAEWEVETYTAEMATNEKVLGYIRSLPGVVIGVSQQTIAPWVQEMNYYRFNAQKNLARFRMVLAIVNIVEMLCELVPHDRSVQQMSDSLLAKYANRLANEILVGTSSNEKFASGLPIAREQLRAFNLPSELSQVSSMDASLDVWEQQLQEMLLAEARLEQIRISFNTLQ